MSKSIYDEALDILVDSFIDPQDENNNCYMFDFRQMNKISKAIRKAQRQEKLLSLYKELSKYVDDEIYAHELSFITRLKTLIRESEKELGEMK